MTDEETLRQFMRKLEGPQSTPFLDAQKQVPIFHPTMQLRFETLHYGEHLQHRTVQLQQLWRSDTAEEWRAVPTE